MTNFARNSIINKFDISFSSEQNISAFSGFQLEFLSISQVINHMTCYNSSALIGGKIYLKKNPLQDLLSSLIAVISTNESTQIYNSSCDL